MRGRSSARQASEPPTGSPVASSVLVAVPSRITPSYDLVHPAAKLASLVARPTRITSSPSAKGSNVPKCPTRVAPAPPPSARRTRSTTSCDVGPPPLPAPPGFATSARSQETSTAVTVTNPIRGSRTPSVRNAATVWRIASATRSGRCLGRRIRSEEARARVHDAGTVGGLDQAVGLPQHALGVPALVRHHAHRELGALPQVVG